MKKKATVSFVFSLIRVAVFVLCLAALHSLLSVYGYDLGDRAAAYLAAMPAEFAWCIFWTALLILCVAASVCYLFAVCRDLWRMRRADSMDTFIGASDPGSC